MPLRWVMGNIVTIASSKGGVGKTVLATCLATNLAARGYRVAVVDADPNASLADWYSLYSGPAITCMTESGHVEVVDVAQREADRHDVTLVDTAGFGSLTASAAIAAADHVLIPVMADRGSVREAIRTARQVESLARAARRAIPYRIVPTQWAADGLAEGAALDSLHAECLPITVRFLPALAAFRKASFTGAGLSRGRVGWECDALIDELAALGALPVGPEVLTDG